eukprot:3319728-Pyramimonas_sp.AAC.1
MSSLPDLVSTCFWNKRANVERQHKVKRLKTIQCLGAYIACVASLSVDATIFSKVRLTANDLCLFDALCAPQRNPDKPCAFYTLTLSVITSIYKFKHVCVLT